MPQIMADHNMRGQLKAIVQFLRSEEWQKFWEEASIVVRTFADLGLEREASDLAVWQACQSQQVVLFTGNRNKQGPDSLEEAIRTCNAADSLPVITLADPIRFKHDRDYAEAAAFKMFDYLVNLDTLRGAGRLYVP